MGVILAEEQFNRKLCYRIAITILIDLKNARLITAKEFRHIEPNLAKKFSPVWADLSNVLKDKIA